MSTRCADLKFLQNVGYVGRFGSPGGGQSIQPLRIIATAANVTPRNAIFRIDFIGTAFMSPFD
jgi:hypothetical protein